MKHCTGAENEKIQLFSEVYEVDEKTLLKVRPPQVK